MNKIKLAHDKNSCANCGTGCYGAVIGSPEYICDDWQPPRPIKS